MEDRGEVVHLLVDVPRLTGRYVIPYDSIVWKFLPQFQFAALQASAIAVD